MARYTTSIRTDLPVADAFALVADLRNLENWDPGVTESVQAEGDGPGADSAYDVTLSTASMRLRYETTEFRGPRSVTYEAKAPWFTSIDVISVDPAGERDDGSIVTYDATLRLPLLLRLGDPLLRLVFRRVGDAAAKGLRRTLDGSFVS